MANAPEALGLADCEEPTREVFQMKASSWYGKASMYFSIPSVSASPLQVTSGFALDCEVCHCFAKGPEAKLPFSVRGTMASDEDAKIEGLFCTFIRTVILDFRVSYFRFDEKNKGGFFLVLSLE